MLEKQFVEELAANARVHSAFVVKSKSLASFRNKPGQFMNLTLADRTGEIVGRVWDNAEELAATFNEGDVVVATGSIQEYQGQLQLIATMVAPADEGSYDKDDMIPRSGKAPEELLAELDQTIGMVESDDLKRLLAAFFADGPMREKMAWAFGARALHHAYAGGLLEHTLSVVKLLLAAHEIHPEMNRDMLIAGGLLHDIGKLQELDGVMTAEYTDVGKFIGHTVLGDRLIRDAIAHIEGFDPYTANLLSHMVLSHHGEREWGAPVVPATMEACALHYADNMDARVQGFKQVIDAEGGGEAHWSRYHRSYERQIYLGHTGEMRQDTLGAIEDAPGEATTGQDNGGDAQSAAAQLDL